jgi:hypothetical protein
MSHVTIKPTTPPRSPNALLQLAKETMEKLQVPQGMVIGVAADGLIIGASYGETRADCTMAGQRLDEVVDFLERNA